MDRLFIFQRSGLIPKRWKSGATIERNVFKAGARLSLKTIDVGRQVILHSRAETPTAAEVTGVAAIGLDVSIATTPDDLTTAMELGLNPEQAQGLTGLRSSPLPTSISLTSSDRELEVRIGQLPARAIKLSSNPGNVSAAATALQAQPERIVARCARVLSVPGDAGREHIDHSYGRFRIVYHFWSNRG